METQLGDIRRDIRDFISSQKDARRDDIESACRRDLRVVDPQDDMERIEKNKDELLDNAYKWILRTPEYIAFTNWEDSERGCPPPLNNATAVLRSLIWLLLLQQPHLISHLLQKYKESGAGLFTDKNAFYALSEAFRKMLRDPQLKSRLL
ncbi:NACHT domain-containing protein [Xylariaceae sp. FL0594]|nr:NACHT domain-containing protein [Xylariaceae sp. FL0594]